MELPRRRLSRRAFLRMTGLAVGCASLGLVATPAVQGAVVSASLGVSTSPAVPAARGTAPHEQSLVVAQSALTETIDPGIDWTFGVGGGVLYWVYDSLYRNIGEEKVTTVPALADGMPEVSADQLHWTIKLKSGRKFHDGSPVTADDVKFSYDRQFQYKMPGPANSTLTMVESVDIVDPLTVRFNLKHPTPWFLVILGDAWANSVVNKKLVEANSTSDEKYPGEKWLATHDAGSGPFMIKAFEPLTRVELTRNPDWPDWAAGPHLDQVTILQVGEPATQRLMFERGQVDVAVNLTPEDVDALIQQQGIAHRDFYTDQAKMFFLSGSWDGKPWKDKRVRQALVSSFNTDVASTLLHGALKLDCGFPPQLVNFKGCSVHTAYDLGRAAALLKEAGYEQGFSIKVNWSEGDPQSKTLLEMWQADLATLGVAMEIGTFPAATAIDMFTKEPFLSGIGSIYVEPMAWLEFWATPKPAFWLPNPWYDTSNPATTKLAALVAQAAQTPDNDQRADLYTQAIDILQDEATWARFLMPQVRIPFHDNLKGYVGYFRQGAEAVPLTSLYWEG